MSLVFLLFTHSAVAVGQGFESILKVVWGCWTDAGVFRHTFRGVWTGQLVLRNSHQLGRFDLWSPWWRGPSPSHKGGGWFWTLHKRDKGAGHAAVGVGGFPGAGCNTQALEEVSWPSSLQMELYLSYFSRTSRSENCCPYLCARTQNCSCKQKNHITSLKTAFHTLHLESWWW